MPLVFVQKSSAILDAVRTLSFIPYRGTMNALAQDTARSLVIPSPYQPPALNVSTEIVQSGTNSLKMNGVYGECFYSSNVVPFTFPGNFTVEMSFYPTAFRSTYLFSFGGGDGVSWGSQSLYTGPDGKLGYQATATNTNSSISADIISNGALYQINQWNHVAVTRTGNIYAVFLNGVRVITTTSSQAPATPPNIIMFGNWQKKSVGNFSESESLTGYIDNIRITKGVSRYNGANTTITVPTFPFGTSLATDPSWNSVSVLLDMEASTDGVPYDQYHSGAFVGQRGRDSIITSIDGSSRSYYGSGSGTFNPYKRYFQIPSFNGAAGTADFTWETRFYHYTKVAAFQTFISTRTTDGPTPSGLILGQNNGVLFVFADKFLIQAGTLNTTAWNHIALVRKDGVFTLYLNGNSVGTYSSSVYDLTNQNTYVGANGNGSQTNQSGSEYMNDIRISQGARYTSNFTPPSVMTV